jgi:hypothetical protein
MEASKYRFFEMYVPYVIPSFGRRKYTIRSPPRLALWSLGEKTGDLARGFANQNRSAFAEALW